MKNDLIASDHVSARPEFPVYMWSKDHWSTLAYIECVCVDHKGKPDLRRIYANAKRHPAMYVNLCPSKEYPIRLKGLQVHNRDEWDCIEDMEALGLINNIGTGINPAFVMLPLGILVSAEIRAHKASGGTFSTFTCDIDALVKKAEKMKQETKKEKKAA